MVDELLGCEVARGFSRRLQPGRETFESLFMDHGPSEPLRPACMQTLGLLPPYSVQDVHRAYREQAKRAHPDAGGSTEQFTALHDAYERALDLANFQDSRRNWLGQRVDQYSERQQLIEQIHRSGGRCRIQSPDHYLADYGADFADILCQLVTVHLSDINLAESTLTLLANSPASRELQLLDLSGTDLTDSGLSLLKDLRLNGLDLRNTSISMRGLRKLRHLSELEWLHVGKTKVGFFNRRRLQQLSPGLDVVTDLNAQPPDFESADYRRLKLMQRLVSDPS